MKIFNRKKNRKQTKLKSDILSSSRILREDVLDLISQYSSKEEAIDGIREFFSDSKLNSLESFKRYGKERSIERIISDIDSYKTWE